MSLPSVVHVSSIIKREASGDWEIRYSVIFQIGSFAKYVHMCICVYVYSIRCSGCCLYFVLVSLFDNRIRFSNSNFQKVFFGGFIFLFHFHCSLVSNVFYFIFYFMVFVNYSVHMPYFYVCHAFMYIYFCDVSLNNYYCATIC